MKILSSIFDNSNIVARNGSSETSIVEIQMGSIVQNCIEESAICIDGYSNYSISDCSITGNSGHGIKILNSGGTKKTKEIKDNTIINNGLITSGLGIQVYHSYVQILGNQIIEGNKYGVSCLNNSNVSMRWNSNAINLYETQIIRDNLKH